MLTLGVGRPGYAETKSWKLLLEKGKVSAFKNSKYSVRRPEQMLIDGSYVGEIPTGMCGISPT